MEWYHQATKYSVKNIPLYNYQSATQYTLFLMPITFPWTRLSRQVNIQGFYCISMLYFSSYYRNFLQIVAGTGCLCLITWTTDLILIARIIQYFIKRHIKRSRFNEARTTISFRDYLVPNGSQLLTIMCMLWPLSYYILILILYSYLK